MPSPNAAPTEEDVEPEKPATPLPPPPTTRVFINDVDTWAGRTIAKRFLASRDIWLAEVAMREVKPPPSPIVSTCVCIKHVLLYRIPTCSASPLWSASMTVCPLLAYYNGLACLLFFLLWLCNIEV